MKVLWSSDKGCRKEILERGKGLVYRETNKETGEVVTFESAPKNWKFNENTDWSGVDENGESIFGLFLFEYLNKYNPSGY